MKVKITHTVLYEDVPEFVSELVRDCKRQISSCQDFKFNIADLKNSSAEIEDVKNKLDLVISKLEDCLNISVGYLNAQVEKELSDIPDFDKDVEDDEG